MKYDAIGMMRQATKKAFSQVQKATNIESDPDLAMYNTLKPEHFTALMKRYGEQPIIDYIKEMETKRLGVKTKGGNNAH